MNRRSPLAFVVLVSICALTACGSRADDSLRQQAAQAALSQGGGGTGGGTGQAAGGTTGAGTTGAGTTGVGTTGTATTGVGTTGAGTTTTGAGTTGATTGGGTGGTGAFNGDNGGNSDIGVTKDSITLGLVADLGGAIPGLFQGALRGTQAYFTKVNSEGGIFGRQLKLDVGDSRLECNAYKTETQKKVDKDFAMVGSFALYDSCGADILNAHPGYADIHSALSPTAQAVKNNFSVAPLGTGWRTGPLSLYKTKFGDAWQHIGSIYAAIGGGKETWDATKAVIQKQGAPWQGHVGYDAAYQPTDTDFTADIIRMQQAGVKMIYMIAGDAAGDANVLHAVRQQASTKGWPVVYGGSAYDTAFLTKAKQDLDLSGVGPTYEDQQYALFFNASDAAVIPAVKEFQTWYGRTTGGASPDLFAAYGWGSAELFVQALKAAGPKATRPTLMAELKKITAFDAGGILAKANPAQKVPGNCWVFTQVISDQWVRTESPKAGFRCDGPYALAAS